MRGPGWRIARGKGNTMYQVFLTRILAICAVCAWAALTPDPSWAQGTDGPHASVVESPQESTPAQEGAAYDSSREATFTGTVRAVDRGHEGGVGLLVRAHTFGLGHTGSSETLLRIETAGGNVEIHLGPPAFVHERGVSIREGDGVEVIGSPMMPEQGSIVLARQIRKGDQVWAVRDPAGQPLWTFGEAPSRFWTRNKIIVVSIVAAKVIALATVLRH